MIGPRAVDYEEFPRLSEPFVCLLTCARVQVNRPLSMKKDGIQTRKRKPKSMGGGAGGAGVARGALSGTFWARS